MRRGMSVLVGLSLLATLVVAAVPGGAPRPGFEPVVMAVAEFVGVGGRPSAGITG